MERAALISGDVQPGGRAAAPGSLELVQAFVNTVDQEHGPDLLDEPEGLAAWAQRRSLASASSARDLAAAREVREALRTLLLAHTGDASPSPDALATLDATAERARLLPRFADASLEPRATGIDALLGAVLAAAFASMADGTWRRLKACPGERCGWAFYDRSANASATWCSMRVCGGRAKARAYYRRRSATSSPSRIAPTR